jgi:glycosyltransferase involved in cell wall biosynthesis
VQNGSNPPVIWLNVGDLLGWPFRQVTGIQRAMLCILGEIRRRPPAESPVRLCRFHEGRGFVLVSEAELDGFARRLDYEFDAQSGLRKRAGSLPASIAVARRTGGAATARFRAALQAADRRLPEAIRLGSRQLVIAVHLRARAARKLLRGVLFPAKEPPPCRMRAGDVLLSIGPGWVQPAYAPAVAALRSEIGFRHVVLIYDLIACKFPTLIAEEIGKPFVDWALVTVRSADRIATISENSRRDVLEYIESLGLPPRPIEVVTLGQDKAAPEANGATPVHEFERDPAGFVLSVGTVEKRKNHALLVEVWRRLLQQRNRAEVPCLVWIGRRGWLVDDLLAELERENWLDGKVVWLNRAKGGGTSEEELDRLYRRCQFTMFPSLYEGWGLPVAESLAYGKLCIASNAASVPEVGGDLVDYHSPEDPAACLRLVERAIYDPEYRRSRGREIATRYRPASWADCAASILASCEKEMRGALCGDDKQVVKPDSR